jgi:hypothetical protein
VTQLVSAGAMHLPAPAENPWSEDRSTRRIPRKYHAKRDAQDAVG